MHAATSAGGVRTAIDLVFEDAEPRNEIIEIRVSKEHAGEAMAQALETDPGAGGQGARSVSARAGSRHGNE